MIQVLDKQSLETFIAWILLDWSIDQKVEVGIELGTWIVIFKLILQRRLSTLDFQADRFKLDENRTDVRLVHEG